MKKQTSIIEPPTLLHRSSYGGQLDCSIDLTDTLRLAIDRAEAVASLAAIAFANGAIPNEQIVLGVFDSIEKELADMKKWLEWWGEHGEALTAREQTKK